MIVYTSSLTNSKWCLNMKAAPLVPESGMAGLPSALGSLEMIEVPEPKQWGLPVRHPLQDRFPYIRVLHYLMVVRDRFMVERNGRRGLALWANYNGSGVCASITSENGRNGIAPYDWEGETGSMTDPAADAFLEWRSVNGSIWQNHMIHGWPGWDGREDRGLDWRDGVPTSLSAMYDRRCGTVRQSVFVPKEYEGLGVAEQTMALPDVKDTYSVVLYFPRHEALPLLDRLKPVWSGSNTVYELSGFEPTLGGTKGATRGGAETFRSTAVETEYKMAVGGEIRQHIIQDPFGPGFWAAEPEVVIVCWPIGELQFVQLGQNRTLGRRRVF